MIAFSTATAFAADVTGTWTAEVQDMNLSYVLKQDGAKLTGTITASEGDPLEITEGKVDGDKISFNVSFNGITIKHQGVINGDTIKLTTKAEGGSIPDGEVTLTRSE
jgi:hypothetical protein